MLVQIKKETLEDLILNSWIMQRICDDSITKQEALAIQKRIESQDAGYHSAREAGMAMELNALYDRFKDLVREIKSEG